MAATVVQLFNQASQLAERDRATLAGLLLESLDGSWDTGAEAAWAEEIESRARQLDAGEAETMSWAEVKAELLARGRAA